MINPSRAPWGINVAAVIQAEAAKITRITGVPFRYLGTTGKSYFGGTLDQRRDPVIIEFSPKVPSRGYAQPLPKAGPWYTSGVVNFHPDTTWKETDPYAVSKFADIAGHELGHIVGLGDTYGAPYYPEQRMGSSASQWGIGDITGLRSLSTSSQAPSCRQPYGLGSPFGKTAALGLPDGKITVRGWGIDSDSRAALNAHIYMDGRLVSTPRADRARTDISQYSHDFGVNHGFEVTVEGVRPGSHVICAYGLNTGPGTNSTLGTCQTTIVPSGAPVGHVDALRPSRRLITAAGWVIDPDTARPTSVHLYVDGKPVAAAVARTPRPDVAAVHRSYGADHGFNVTFAAAPGRRTVCIYGINLSVGTNSNLGCRVVTVPA